MQSNDLISRAAALNALLMSKDYRDACDALEQLPAVDAAPTVSRWISVEDRLPAEGQVVLTLGTRSIATGMFRGVTVRPYMWYWRGHTVKHVTHWMPLPEPPKEEDDAEQ